jgi:hypothetical protein
MPQTLIKRQVFKILISSIGLSLNTPRNSALLGKKRGYLKEKSMSLKE